MTRLETLPGSFSSLDLDEASTSAQTSHETDENTPALNSSMDPSSSDVAGTNGTAKSDTENDRLRKEVADLQSQLESLRSHLLRERADRRHAEHVQRKQLQQAQQKIKKTKQPTKSKSGQGVVLELPKAIGCLKSGPRDGAPKDHQSLSTEDDQETIEPTHLEAHESAGGLKHRNYHPSSVLDPKLNVETLRKTIRQSSNDGSLSSSEGPEDEEVGGLGAIDEKDGLLKTEMEIVEPGTTTPGLDESFWQSVSDRAVWLVGLLVLQSMSSFILARNEALLQEHLVIVRFLTMLVGAGGNAGNQASVRGM